jgi:hypothetical protein
MSHARGGPSNVSKNKVQLSYFWTGRLVNRTFQFQAGGLEQPKKHNYVSDAVAMLGILLPYT